MNRPPTVKQLLVLADRAERGRLSAAEASRLREGIASLAAVLVSTRARLSWQTRLRKRDAQQAAAFCDVVRRAKARGARTVAVWALERLLDHQGDDDEEAA